MKTLNEIQLGNEIQVSNETANYVRSLRKLSALYSSIDTALTEQIGDEGIACEVLEKNIYPLVKQIEGYLYQRMNLSIAVHIGEKNSTSI